MILPNDITNLKTDITDKIGQKIIVKGTLGRSRFFEKEATIEKTYPNLFIVFFRDSGVEIHLVFLLRPIYISEGVASILVGLHRC